MSRLNDTLGFHLGFLGAAAFVLHGIVAVATIGNGRDKPHPEPCTPNPKLTAP